MAALRHLGLAGSYEARLAGHAELETAIDELREGLLHGANITMPLKRAAAAAADHLTPEAQVSNSANTLRFRDGLVEGHSTDVVASRFAFSDPRFDIAAPILIQGAGGAAAAALVGAEGRVVYMTARDPARAASVSSLRVGPTTVVPFGTGVVGAILVNATPLGMGGEFLPEATLAVASGLIDLPYGDQPTPAVQLALDSGLPVMDGIEFLVLQALASFEWWTGIEAPREVMLERARKP
jgi:shikimate dehydrogenase